MNYIYFVFFLVGLTSCTSKVKLHTLQVGHKQVQVEISDTHSKRQKGLMNRESLGKDEGMLFVFEHEQRLGFWMKNTLIPLSIGFFNTNCELIDVQEMIPASKSDSRPKTYFSLKPARFALEMNKNWFEKNNIKVKDKLISNSRQISFCKK